MPLTEEKATAIVKELRETFKGSNPTIKREGQRPDKQDVQREVHLNVEHIDTEQFGDLAFRTSVDNLDIALKRSGTGISIKIY